MRGCSVHELYYWAFFRITDVKHKSECINLALVETSFGGAFKSYIPHPLVNPLQSVSIFMIILNVTGLPINPFSNEHLFESLIHVAFSSLSHLQSINHIDNPFITKIPSFLIWFFFIFLRIGSEEGEAIVWIKLRLYHFPIIKGIIILSIHFLWFYLLV